MNYQDIFFSTKPTYPWSIYPVGLPALAAVALLLVVLTLWTYLGRPQANPKRILIVMGLRLLALLVALLTTLRPSLGIQEDPKVPSTLLIGVDVSESMTVRDEVGDLTRFEAVKRTLERSQSVLDELRDDHNLNVQFYGFGPADFTEEGGEFDPDAPPVAQRSDYGTYLYETLQRWQGERFIRGHLIIGDGADNGTRFNALAEAARWRQNTPVHTFVVGTSTVTPDAKDVAIAAVAADPSPVPIKNDLNIRVIVNAFGFVGATVPVKVSFDTGDGYKDVATERVTLTQERNNEVTVPVKAPDQPGEIKVKVEIPIDSVPGDVAPQNNEVETYFTVTKEGVRILLVNRLGFENAALRRALASDRRIDLYQVIRQTDDPPTPSEREAFDFDNRAYDVIIIGNVSGKQITSIDSELPARIAQQVRQRGVGVLFMGGHATLAGTPNMPGAEGWLGIRPIEEILPVDLRDNGPFADNLFTNERARFQYLPTRRQAGHFLNRLDNNPEQSNALWTKLNELSNRSRFTGLSRIGMPIGTATLYAVASDVRESLPVPVDDARTDTLPPLLVGHQIGEGDRGRVLVFAAQDTFLWQRLGQPESNDGMEIHDQFWRQLVLWLAHQEEDEGAAFARPEFRRLPVMGKQTIRVGLRGPEGADAVEPKFEVKVIAPSETEEAATVRPVLPDPEGGFRVDYEPIEAGEYIVKVQAAGQTADGQEIEAEATARFLTYPEVTDEMLRTASDPDFMKALANAGGGKFHRLEELPRYLQSLINEPIDLAKPRPKYLPDWRREKSPAFLTSWLLLFVTLIGTEWGLRRLWGMA